MRLTRFQRWFDRAVSSNGHHQRAIPAVSFAISFAVFSLVFLIVNKGWYLVGNAVFDAKDSYEPLNVADSGRESADSDGNVAQPLGFGGTNCWIQAFYGERIARSAIVWHSVMADL